MVNLLDGQYECLPTPTPTLSLPLAVKESLSWSIIPPLSPACLTNLLISPSADLQPVPSCPILPHHTILTISHSITFHHLLPACRNSFASDDIYFTMVDRVLADRKAATQGSPHVPSYQRGIKEGPVKAVVRTVPRIVLNA